MPPLPAKVRRAALEALGRDTLASLTQKFDVAVQDRRAAAAHVDALMRSRTVEFAAILGELQREDLKAICGTLGLDRSGREKDVLVKRILDAPGATSTASNGNGAGPEVVEEPAPGGKLTIDQLEAYLWGAADKLRGKIDSSDYKSFIFGFLFLKRLSDVFEEEAEKLIAAGTAPEVAWEDRDYHRFYVPKRARWSTIQKQATGIGDHLNKACAALEEENASLEGVLRGIDYNDENKLGHAKERDELLARLVHHFSKISLRNDNLAEPDMLGRAYEYLIERFADDAGKKGGEFYTPRKVVQLIVELLQPSETDRICDPTVGSGGMLIECAKYVERHGGDPRKLTLHGQENNLGTWAICKMNMLLHGLPDARIEKGDTIRNPRLVKDGALEVYDKVLANPPFSLDDWGRETAEADSFGRFKFGLPPKTKGEFAFVEHMVATMNLGGRTAVVMPHGVLFRRGAEGGIREALLGEDLIEAVIGLPPNLFYGAGLAAALLVLAKSKPASRKGKVLFIDASREFREETAQNYLRDEDIKKIASTYHAWAGIDRYARVVPFDEIRRNKHTLAVSRYVSSADDLVRDAVSTCLGRLSEAEQRWQDEMKDMRLALESVKALSAVVSANKTGDVPEGWRLLKVKDAGLVQGGRQRSPHAVGADRPYLRVANVFDGYIDTSDVLSMPFTDAEAERYKLKVGDILLNEGQSLELVGRSAIYRGAPSDCCFQNTLIRFRAYPGLLPEFAHLVFQWMLYAGVFSRVATQTTSIAHLGVSRFSDLSIVVPPEEVQRRIIGILGGIESAVRLSSMWAKAGDAARRSLMGELLPGPELLVGDDE